MHLRELVVARVKLQGIFYEEKCRHIYFLKRTYCMQFLGFNTGKSTLFLKFLLILLDASTYSEHRDQTTVSRCSGCLEEVKTNGKL